MRARQRPHAQHPGLVRGFGNQLARQGALDQRAGFVDTVKRDEATETRPLIGAQQHLIQRLEPILHRLETMIAANGKDHGLQGFGIRRLIPCGQTAGQILKRGHDLAVVLRVLEKKLIRPVD